jgi:hypothetical protein
VTCYFESVWCITFVMRMRLEDQIMKCAFAFLLIITGCAPVFQPKAFAYDKHVYDVASFSNGRMVAALELSDQCKDLGKTVRQAATEIGLRYFGTFEGIFSGNSLDTIEYLNYAIPKSTPITQNTNPSDFSWKTADFGYYRTYPLLFSNGYGVLSIDVIDRKNSSISGSRICLSYSFPN